MRATWPANFIFIVIITLVEFDEAYMLWSSDDSRNNLLY